MCPARTRVGSGRAEGVRGGGPVGFDLAVYAVRGKLVFAAGKQSFDRIAHGRRLALTVPTLSTAPSPRRCSAPGSTGLLRTPRTCRGGGWRFGATFQGLTAVGGSPVGGAQHLSYTESCR